MKAMRIGGVLGLVISLGLLASAALPSSAVAGDKDCSDFATQRAAQIFFLERGGPRSDPDRLDADHDGIACEDNPCPCDYKKHLPKSRLWQREFAFSTALLALIRPIAAAAAAGGQGRRAEGMSGSGRPST